MSSEGGRGRASAGEGTGELAHHTITQEATAMGCQVLARNGMADHLPLLVRIPATVAPAALVKQMKGISSHAINDLLAPPPAFAGRRGTLRSV